MKKQLQCESLMCNCWYYICFGSCT